jgi:hypothetical protein
MKIDEVTKDPQVKRVFRAVALFNALGMKGTIDWLTRHGIKGYRQNGRSCVLAECLQQVGGTSQVNVGDYIQVKDVRIRCPQVLKRIWAAFDSGVLPELEKSAVPAKDLYGSVKLDVDKADEMSVTRK